MLYPVREAVLVSFCSSFDVTEDADSAVSCQHANTCCVGCYPALLMPPITHQPGGFQSPSGTAQGTGRRVRRGSDTGRWFLRPSQRVRSHPRLSFLSPASAPSLSPCPECFSQRWDCPHWEHPERVRVTAWLPTSPPRAAMVQIAQ